MKAQLLDPQPYDSLITGDLRDHLLQVTEPLYDVICASNVMQLIGGLTPVIDGAAKALKPNGYFIFTTYALKSQEDYQFIGAIKRFAHSSKYINDLADRAGLKVTAINKTLLYKNDVRDAHLVILQK